MKKAVIAILFICAGLIARAHAPNELFYVLEEKNSHWTLRIDLSMETLLDILSSEDLTDGSDEVVDLNAFKPAFEHYFNEVVHISSVSGEALLVIRDDSELYNHDAYLVFDVHNIQSGEVSFLVDGFKNLYREPMHVWRIQNTDNEEFVLADGEIESIEVSTNEKTLGWWLGLSCILIGVALLLVFYKRMTTSVFRNH